MFTQLWAMHLFFIALACLHRTLDRGDGHRAAVISSACPVLSHAVYAYMLGVTALVLLGAGANRANLRSRLVRLALVGGLAAVITAYFWRPFFRQIEYLSVSPYLKRWKYDSFGTQSILTWLVTGDLFDHGRLPVLTLLLAIGVVTSLVTRTRPARLALLLFMVWLALYFGRPTRGALADMLFLH